MYPTHIKRFLFALVVCLGAGIAMADLKSDGDIRANTFYGSGAGLTGISGSGVGSGDSPTWTGVHTWTSSATFQHNLFSIGASTLVVTGGRVGINASSPNAALQVGGNANSGRRTTIGSNGDTDIRVDDNSQYVPIVIGNHGIDAASQGVSFKMNLERGNAASGIAAVQLDAVSEQSWSGSANQDAALVFKTARNGSLLEGFRLNSDSNIVALGSVTANVFSGAGTGLTGIPAASIASGSLGSSVIASSVAVGAFYSDSAVRTNLGLAIGSNVQPYDTDLDDLADGTLSGSKVGSGVPAANIASGSLGSSVVASSIAVGGFYSDAAVRSNLGLAIGSNVQAYDTDLDDLADGSLTGSKVGSGVPAANIASGSLGSQVIASSIAVGGFYSDDAVRSNLGLAIGSNVQAFDADLSDLADGSLTGSKVGDGVPAANIAAGSLDTDVMVTSATIPMFFSHSTIRSNLGLAIGTDVQAFDADLSDLADGSLTGSKVGDGVPAANIAAGTLDTDVIASSIAVSGFYNNATVRSNLGLAIGSNVQAYDADLDDLADGSLTGSKVGSGVPAANIASGSLGSQVIASSIAVNSVLSANIVDGSVSLTSDVTGTLPLANGGTGLSVKPIAEIPISPAALKGTVTNGAGDSTNFLSQSTETSTSINYDYVSFVDGTTKYAYFSYDLPPGFDGSTVTFKVVWTSTAGTTTSSATWCMSAVALADGNALATADGTAVCVSDAIGSLNTSRAAPESAALTIGNTWTAGDAVHWRIYRNPAHADDTVASAVNLLGIQIRYQRASYSE